jgi:tetratricopeptide (TPR) repeat protein
MSFDEQLSTVLSAGRPGAGKLAELARTALDQQREADVLPLLNEATKSGADARLWQWKALLERALDDHGEALKSFARAAELAPADASIAHGRARVALEAGLPAVDLFTRALQLAPSDAGVYLGLNAARMAAGNAAEVESELDNVLARSPLWLDGHHQLAQVRSLLGRRAHAFDSLEREIQLRPKEPALWQALFELQIQAEDYPLLARTLERAKNAAVPARAIRTYEFIAAAELGQTKIADAILEAEGASIPPVWLVRHYLRSDRVDDAAALVDSELRGARAADIMPYAETTWRLRGDPRLEWLTGHPNLISVIDLNDAVGAIDGLAELLRSLHRVSGRYLNQSVRGGSQTDGPLFSRTEPEIRALRSIVVDAVTGHSDRLQSLPDSHPQKMRAGGNVRFSGSWSVRLVDGGFHASHVHPRGWISSALYIALPGAKDDGDPFAGWLSLGEPPPELGLGLDPTRMIEPKVGQLVLFPSWMWHGTRPFPHGERMTVAFDVAPPL